MPCRATQDTLVIVKNSDKMWSIGGGNGKPFQYSCWLNPINNMKRHKDMTWEDVPPRTKGVQSATGDTHSYLIQCSMRIFLIFLLYYLLYYL